MLKPGASQLDDISYRPDDIWQERLGPGMDGSMAGGATLDQDRLAVYNSCVPTHLCQDPKVGLGVEVANVMVANCSDQQCGYNEEIFLNWALLGSLGI